MNGTHQQPDTKRDLYYVSAMNETGQKWVPLLGPFPDDHAAALGKVDDVRTLACDLDPRGVWWSYGTARIDHRDAPPQGRLNAHFAAVHQRQPAH
ncbi:hypothetical protein A8H39_00515 [Paraburkholderia fungorum]|uniref:hypothetical protein n=1 Tax=Paraburkholderia fungorum TaxID=134537 RepID=UPI00048204FC|nr:hypothetical protein [Paraburkholderia fungorum]PNE59667.1 hypothetical protein A8H39_00515 [Paraburkholderia fungorum]